MAARTSPSYVDEVEVNRIWQNVKHAILDILNKNLTNLHLEDLYKMSYTLVLHKKGEMLYNGLKELFKAHLINLIRPSVLEANDTDFLSNLVSNWEDFKEAMVRTLHVTMYLNRVYVQLQRKDLPQTNILGFQMFRDSIILHPIVNARLKKLLFENIEYGRQSENFEWGNIKTAVDMLLTLSFETRDFYENEFENMFIKKTIEYYKKASQELLANVKVNVFQKLNYHLSKEKTQAIQYLDPISFDILMNVLRELIITNMQALITVENDGILKFLKKNCVLDLNQLYDILQNKGSVQSDNPNPLNQYIVKRKIALHVINDAVASKNAENFVSSFQKFNEIFDELLDGINFIRKFREYYKGYGKELMIENNGIIFVQKAVKSINEENERCEGYMDTAMYDTMMKVFTQELIIPHVEAVIYMENGGLFYMLNNKNKDDLKLLSFLLEKIPNGFNILAESIMKYINCDSETFVKFNEAVSSKNTLNIIQINMELMDEWDQNIAELFEGNSTLKNNVHVLIANLINPELLTFCIDNILRMKSLSNEENLVESVLDKAVIIFKLLKEKDVFEECYKRSLAKRLLCPSYNILDVEKSMILKLKIECGEIFAQKLEGIIKDMDLSKMLVNEFKEKNVNHNIDFTAQILTSIYWPFYKSKICILPTSVDSVFKEFQDFYGKKYPNRSLNLNPSFGFADLKASFFKKATDGSSKFQETTKILTVTTYQMCVLMRFNEKETFTFKELIDDTQISNIDLKTVLISLTTDNKKHQKVLNRQSFSNNIEENDVFSVNDEFSSNKRQIRIQMIPLKDASEKENKELRSEVIKSRKHEIEAALVRVIKGEQKIFHNLLITKVTELLHSRFLPDPTTIKKCIESLIEREYLKRDDSDSQIYIYIA